MTSNNKFEHMTYKQKREIVDIYIRDQESLSATARVFNNRHGFKTKQDRIGEYVVIKCLEAFGVKTRLPTNPETRKKDAEI
jgi:hypothetical protein